MDRHTQVMDALREVYDPCCEDRRLSVVDMGLIEDIRLEEGSASIDLVLTSGWCPFMVPLVDTIRDRIAAVPDITDAEVTIVWDTAWTSERLSPVARERLHFLPPPSALPDGPAGLPTAPTPPSTEVPR
jgi:metal-sulfur cluster biosynthetic enzyme